MESSSRNELSGTADSASWNLKQKWAEKFEVNWSKCGNEEFNILRAQINQSVPVCDINDKSSPELSNSLPLDYSLKSHCFLAAHKVRCLTSKWGDSAYEIKINYLLLWNNPGW